MIVKRKQGAGFHLLVVIPVQETYEISPTIRAACERRITSHPEPPEPDLEAATCDRNVLPRWTAKSLARYTQAFILAKATGRVAVAANSLGHLRR